MSFSSSVPARGVRVHWEDLPPRVQTALEHRLGSTVVEAITQPHGFSPGLAARLRLDDGRRVFVKAVSETANPETHRIHRREARILGALPASAPAPRLLWSFDDLGWVALGLEDVDGRHPDEPWTEHDLGLVIDTVEKMATDLTPSPIRGLETAASWFENTINGWQTALKREEKRLDPWVLRNLDRLADLEKRAPVAAAGETLMHCDLRADNLLIAGDRVYVVDWPWARIGAPWIDLVGMAPSVAMQGGPPPEEFIQRLDLGGVGREAMDAVVCTIAGYFVVHALDPPPPGLPTLREFQAAQGRAAIAWLQARLGRD